MTSDVLDIRRVIVQQCVSVKIPTFSESVCGLFIIE